MEEFKAYQGRVIENAQALAEGLMKREIRLVSGGTDNHLILVDLRSKNVTGKAAEKLLDLANITCNKNAIPNDPEKPSVTSGIRLGTAAVTTRGMMEEDMDMIAEAVRLVVEGAQHNQRQALRLVEQLTEKYPLYD